MKRTPEEIIARCKPILDDKKVIFLVEKSSSPSAAYEMIENEIQNTQKAKAGRWLALLRRDHIHIYKELLNAKATKP